MRSWVMKKNGKSTTNTVLTPHLGFTTEEGLHAFYQPALENILAFLDGAPKNLMNPEVLKPKA